MLIQEITTDECLRILAVTRLGRLACVHQNQPYIVPINFVFENPYLYGFTTHGQKVDWMRSNPLVCVEIDEVEACDKWTSILVFGRYEELQELPGTPQYNLDQRRPREPWQPTVHPTGNEFRERKRLHALELLQKHQGWWEVGGASRMFLNPDKLVTPIYYRILTDQVTGRRAIRDG